MISRNVNDAMDALHAVSILFNWEMSAMEIIQIVDVEAKHRRALQRDRQLADAQEDWGLLRRGGEREPGEHPGDHEPAEPRVGQPAPGHRLGQRNPLVGATPRHGSLFSWLTGCSVSLYRGMTQESTPGSEKSYRVCCRRGSPVDKLKG